MNTRAGRVGALTEQLDSVVTTLDLIRSGAAATRPELARFSGLGRNVVSQRVGHLLSSGLVGEGTLGPSTGGRSPRKLRFRSEAGHVLVAELGATSIGVALSDLSGQLIGEREIVADVGEGPEAVLGRIDELFQQLLVDHPTPVWGVGIGLPGPVEFRTGRPVAPPIMPGWNGFGVREFFSDRYAAPVWVDNDVNLMVLGEVRAGDGRHEMDVVYVKIGTGIGAGLVSGGRIHRGAQGCAGDIGHNAIAEATDVRCRCGRVGCLEAIAGGAALAREATAAALDGRSPRLAEMVSDGKRLEGAHVAEAASFGDPVSIELMARSARLVGEAVARFVNFFNPSLILVGGGVAEAGDSYLATVREVVLSRSLPLATRNLRIIRSPLSDHSGLVGAALMVIDELFSKDLIREWLEYGTPEGRPALATRAADSMHHGARASGRRRTRDRAATG